MAECAFLRRADDGTCLLSSRWCGNGGACPTSQAEADAWWRQATGLWPLGDEKEFPWPGNNKEAPEEAPNAQDDLFGEMAQPLEPDADSPRFIFALGVVSSRPIVDKLVGVDLDYWVALAIKAQFVEIVGEHTCFADYKAAARAERGAPFGGGEEQMACMFQPSTDWQKGGYVIERNRIGIAPDTDGWYADMEMLTRQEGSQAEYAYGPTPLIAAMRCLVRSVYGHEAPAVYPCSELTHRPDPKVKFWRDDPEQYQVWLEREYEIWGAEFKDRDIAFAHSMALLDDELMELPEEENHE